MISIFFLAVLGIVPAVRGQRDVFHFCIFAGDRRRDRRDYLTGEQEASLKLKAPNASRELIAIDDVKGAWKLAALYVAVAFAVVFVVFLLTVDGAESFSRNDDTTVHLAIVRGFPGPEARSPRCMQFVPRSERHQLVLSFGSGMWSRQSWRLSSAIP